MTNLYALTIILVIKFQNEKITAQEIIIKSQYKCHYHAILIIMPFTKCQFLSVIFMIIHPGVSTSQLLKHKFHLHMTLSETRQVSILSVYALNLSQYLIIVCSGLQVRVLTWTNDVTLCLVCMVRSYQRSPVHFHL